MEKQSLLKLFLPDIMNIHGHKIPGNGVTFSYGWAEISIIIQYFRFPKNIIQYYFVILAFWGRRNVLGSYLLYISFS